MIRKRYADILSNYVKAGNESCSPQVLSELAHSDVDRIRLRVAENPCAPREVLELLATDKNPDVRVAVGTNPSTPFHIKCSLAFDEDTNVRLGIAMDMGAPLELLQRLTEDSNPYVSCSAQKTKDLINSDSSHSSGRHRLIEWASKYLGQSEPRFA